MELKRGKLISKKIWIQKNQEIQRKKSSVEIHEANYLMLVKNSFPIPTAGLKPLELTEGQEK